MATEMKRRRFVWSFTNGVPLKKRQITGQNRGHSTVSGRLPRQAGRAKTVHFDTLARPNAQLATCTFFTLSTVKHPGMGRILPFSKKTPGNHRLASLALQELN
jgi:hypothetical protein